MPILFSAVAYEKKNVSSYSPCDGNFMEIAEEVLLKIPIKNHKMTYSHGHYLLHYIVDNDYFYFCVTDKTCQRSRAFLFLSEIKRRFTPSESSGFHKVLAEEMCRYSEDYNTITIRKGDLDELNSIGVGFSESILGEKILFVNNPEVLRYSTITQVGDVAQTPSLETPEYKHTDILFQTTNYIEHSNNSVATTECKEHSDTTNSLKSKERSGKSNYLYCVIVTVILVVLWMILYLFTPMTVALVLIPLCAFATVNPCNDKKTS